MGIVSEDIFWDSSSYRGCNLNEQAASGVDVVRQTFDWAQIEVARNRYAFSWYDKLVAAVSRRGMRLLPIVFNAPRFRSSKRRGRRGAYLPRRYDDMGRFAARLVRRYGPRGGFWRERPDVPRIPIRSWQVWNEPNIRVYWPPRPNPREYARLLEATAKHIRRADPGAEIVTAGIPDSTHGILSLPSWQACTGPAPRRPSTRWRSTPTCGAPRECPRSREGPGGSWTGMAIAAARFG